MLSLFVLAISLFLVWSATWKIFHFVVSMWWVQTTCIFHHGKDTDYKKISYNTAGMALPFISLIVGIFGALYWLKIFAV